jgi:hypothetical protein
LIQSGGSPTFVSEPQEAFSFAPQSDMNFGHQKVIQKVSDESIKKWLKKVKNILKKPKFLYGIP